MNGNPVKKIILISILIFSLVSCTNAKSADKRKAGDDAEYFMALKSLAKNDAKDARVKLNKAVKRGSPLVARRSAETLCSVSDIQQRIESAKKLIAVYQDDEALLTACKVFFANNEMGLILSSTSNLDILNAPDELVYYRVKAMSAKGMQGLGDLVKKWFLEKPLSSEHQKIWKELSGSLALSKDDLFLLNFRTDVYKKDYNAAFEKLVLLEERISEDYGFLTDQLMSDIGKTHLYGSDEIFSSATWFQYLGERLAQSQERSSLEFYCWFYAGRLFDKLSGYGSKVAICYDNAIKCTDNLQKKDNARWYLFRSSLKESTEKCLDVVIANLPDLSDPSYYDDFFDLLAQIMVSGGYYSQIGDLYRELKIYGSKEAAAKFAYIYGRLIQEEVYFPSERELQGRTKEDEIWEAFMVASDSATDLYYKIMAAEKLYFSDSEKERVLCAPKKTETTEKINVEADKLLSGYALFGFPEKIYSEWVRLGQPLLSEETTINICRLLLKCSKGASDDFYPQSLRIASRYANYSPVGVSKELLKYCFPKCYENLITNYAEQNRIEPAVFFALVRSESFFDADVTSSAGAIGLCQLMKFTAEDVARRLHITEYDLNDPETNIKFGTWYLGNLISRLEGNYLDAFFSYNAGISRVRKWKQSSAHGFGLSDLPEDLFLESLPYAETREYGRKLVSATEMYRWLETSTTD